MLASFRKDMTDMTITVGWRCQQSWVGHGQWIMLDSLRPSELWILWFLFDLISGNSRDVKSLVALGLQEFCHCFLGFGFGSRNWLDVSVATPINWQLQVCRHGIGSTFWLFKITFRNERNVEPQQIPQKLVSMLKVTSHSNAMASQEPSRCKKASEGIWRNNCCTFQYPL